MNDVYNVAVVFEASKSKLARQGRGVYHKQPRYTIGNGYFEVKMRRYFAGIIPLSYHILDTIAGMTP